MTRQEFNELDAGDEIELKTPDIAAAGVVLKATTKGHRIRWQEGNETVVPIGIAPFLNLIRRPVGPCAVGMDQLPENPDEGKA